LPNQGVNCLDWHPYDENILISGSNDRYIKVWNIKDESEPVFKIHTPQ
jgi:WD40 repeat protein